MILLKSGAIFGRLFPRHLVGRGLACAAIKHMKTFQLRDLSWCFAAVVWISISGVALGQAAPPAPMPPPLPKTSPLKIVPQKNNTPRPVAPTTREIPGAVAQVNPPSSPQIVSPVVAVPPAGTPIPSAPFASPIPGFGAADPNAIKWDAELKEHSPKVGDAEAKFSFWLTNVSSSDVLINSVRTSCGCTVAKLPAQPWRIPPGSNGPIDVTLNLAGKSGLISKGVTVDTSVGIKQLTVRANIPAPAGGVANGGVPVMASGTMGDAERLKNMQLALADRQVLFKNQDCAKCHAEPAKGKTDGRLLYAAVCATCHNSQHRAAQVPDLRTLAKPTDADYWRQWIMHGRAGSMMPAFAESEGGPLNQQQVNALVDFMVKAFPSRHASFE